MAVTRRHLLRHAALVPLAWAAVPALAAGPNTEVLAAAWQRADRFFVGWLALVPGQPVVEIGAIEVPTRAHHVGVDAAGRLLAVARRPGDWLLRWDRPGSTPQWQWIEDTRYFNGHAVTSPDGRRVFTTETDLDSGAACVGVRDAVSLAKLAEWPTGGTDAHQLLFDPQAPTDLLVANGGVTTRPETGRVKQALQHMDSSLVRLDTRSGARTGVWRLSDPRLSLRHMAWLDHGQGPGPGRMLGLALQAEHDDAEARAAAPVLALFDGRELRGATQAMPLAGYGGDITASAQGFIVSCPRAGGLARFDTAGAWQGFTPLAQACALAVDAQGQAVAAGEPRGLRFITPGPHDDGASGLPQSPFELGLLRLDNHWTWTSLSPRQTTQPADPTRAVGGRS